MSETEQDEEFQKVLQLWEEQTKAPEPVLDELVAKAALAKEITKVVVRYSGYGDSGQVDGVDFYKGEQEVDFKDGKVVDALSDFAMAKVDQHFAGWENNDGASGEVVIVLANRTAIIEHESYYTTSEHSTVELKA